MIIPDYKEKDGTLYPRPANLKAFDVKDDFGFDPTLFSIPNRFKAYVDKVILPRGLIKNRWD